MFLLFLLLFFIHNNNCIVPSQEIQRSVTWRDMSVWTTFFLSQCDDLKWKFHSEIVCNCYVSTLHLFELCGIHYINHFWNRQVNNEKGKEIAKASEVENSQKKSWNKHVQFEFYYWIIVRTYMYYIYRTRAIISRGLYTFLPHFHTFGLMFGLYSRAASNQEWPMMARVR